MVRSRPWQRPEPATTEQPWVGRSVLRVEDDALLRGEGRFLDDLAPVARTLPRGRRALAARPRPDRGRRDGGARAARRRRRPHRRRRRRAVAPVPGRDRDAACRSTRPRSTRCATSASRSPSSSPATATSPRTRPSSSRSTTTRSTPCSTRSRPPPTPVHDRTFSYGDVDGAMAEADLVLRQTFHVPPLHLHAGRVLRGRRRLGRDRRAADRLGELPGAVHAARRRRGRARAQGRPAAAADAARLGRLVRDQVVGVRVRRADRARRPPPRRAGDAGSRTGSSTSRRAPRRRAARPRSRPASRADGRLLALRYDAIEDVGAYVRAPEPATLYRMHGSLSGAYRVPNVAVRNRVVLTNTIPSGPQPRLRRAAALLRARADDGDRRPAPRPRSGRARAPQPDPGRRDALPHAVGRAVRLGRLRGLPRPGARARRLRRARERGSTRLRADGRPRRDRARLHRRAVDLEHGLHHARPDRRRARADAAEVGQRRGRVDRDRPARRDHRAARVDAAGAGPPNGLRPGRRRRARLRSRGRHRDVRDGHGERAVDASPPATTRRASPASPSAPSRRPRSSCARRSTRSARTPATRASRCAGSRAWRTGTPRGCRPGEEPGLAAVAFWAPPTLDPPDADDRVASSAAHGFIVDICAVEVDRETGRGERARLRHRARRRAAAQPAARRRPGARRLRPRRRGGALRAPRLRRVGQPDDRVARRLPRPDRARHPGAADRPPLVDRRP